MATREETKRMIEVMQAYVDGAEIENSSRDASVIWTTAEPEWEWCEFVYRAKPTPREFWVVWSDRYPDGFNSFRNKALAEINAGKLGGHIQHVVDETDG